MQISLSSQINESDYNFYDSLEEYAYCVMLYMNKNELIIKS